MLSSAMGYCYADADIPETCVISPWRSKIDEIQRCREEIHFMHSRSPGKIEVHIYQVTELCNSILTPQPHYFAMLGILHRTVHFTSLFPSPK